MKQTNISISSNQKRELASFLRFFDPDRVENKYPYSPLTLSKEEEDIKSNIFHCLKIAKAEQEEKNKIISEINKLLNETEFTSQRQAYFKQSKKQDIFQLIEKAKVRMKERNRDSESYNIFITFLSQLRDLNENNLTKFTENLNRARKLSPLQRQSFQLIQWIGDSLVKKNIMVVQLQDKFSRFITKVLQYGPTQQFYILNQFENEKIKGKLIKLIQYMQTNFVIISKVQEMFRSMAYFMGNNYSKEQQIFRKLNQMPQKVKLALEPIYKDFVRLKNSQLKNNKQQISPPRTYASIRKGYTYQYLTQDMKKAQEESVNQLVTDLSESKAANDKLQLEINKISKIIQKISNINPSLQNYDLNKQIEEELQSTDSSISKYLCIVHKKIMNHEEFSRSKDNKEYCPNLKQQNNAKRCKIRMEQPNQVRKEVEERSDYQHNQQQLEELMNKIDKKQKQIKTLQNQNKRLKDSIQEYEKYEEVYKSKINNYKIQIELIKAKNDQLQITSKEDKQKMKQIIQEKQIIQRQMWQRQIQQENIQKQTKIEQLKREVQQIKRQKNNNPNQKQLFTYRQLQSQNQLLKNQIVSLQQTLNKKNQVTSQKQLTNATKTNDALMLELVNQKHKKQMQEYIHELQDQLADKERELFHQKSIIEQIKYELAQIKKQAHNQDQNGKGQAQIHLNKQILRMQQQNTQLKKNTDYLKAQLNQQQLLQVQNQRLKTENLSLKKQKIALKNNRDQQKNQDDKGRNQTKRNILTNQEEMKLMKAEYQKLSNKYRELFDNTKQIEQKYGQLKVQNSNLTKQLLKATQKQDSQKMKKEESDEINRCKQNQKYLLQNYKDLERTHQELKKYNEAIKKQFDKLKKEKCVSQNKAYQQELSQQIKELSQQNQNLKAQMNEITIQYNQINDNYNALRSQQQHKDNFQQAFKNQKKQTSLTVQNLQRENTYYQEQLREINNKYMQLQDRNVMQQQRMQQEISDQRVIILKLEQKLEVGGGEEVLIIKEKLEYLEELMAEKNNEIRKFEMQLSKKQQKIMELQIELNNYEIRQ